MTEKTNKESMRYEYSTHRMPWTETTKEFYEQHKNDGAYRFRAVYTTIVLLTSGHSQSAAA